MTSLINEFFDKKSTNLSRVLNRYVEEQTDEVIKPKSWGYYRI